MVLWDGDGGGGEMKVGLGDWGPVGLWDCGIEGLWNCGIEGLWDCGIEGLGLGRKERREREGVALSNRALVCYIGVI